MTLEALEKIAQLASGMPVKEVPGTMPRGSLQKDTIIPNYIDTSTELKRHSVLSNGDSPDNSESIIDKIRFTDENRITNVSAEGDMSTEMPVQGFWRNFGNELGLTNFKPQMRRDSFSSLTQYDPNGKPVARSRNNNMYMGDKLVSGVESHWGNFIR